MRAPTIAPPAAAPAMRAAPCPPQMLPEQLDAAAPPKPAPPPAPTASPMNVLLLRRAFALTETRVTCCRSMDRGPLPGLKVRGVPVTFSNLPPTALDCAVATRTSVPAGRAWTRLQSAGGWAAEVAAATRSTTSALCTFRILVESIRFARSPPLVH